MTSLPRMYTEFASWWRLLSPPEAYAEEAAFYQQALLGACDGIARTLLELGSGGGNNASFLKRRFDMVLVDPAAEMLASSRTLNPECEHHLGDMRTFRLGRTFDCVFIHDAIAYMTTAEDLRAAIETAYLHCRPGGSALFAPDHLRETFHPSTDHGGEDDGARGMRYLEWTWDPDPNDSTCIVDYVYAFRDSDGGVTIEHDRHLEGLFGRDHWLSVLRDVGFEPSAVPFDHSEIEAGSYELFVGRKPR